jgi:hypothetical protein
VKKSIVSALISCLFFFFVASADAMNVVGLPDHCTGEEVKTQEAYFQAHPNDVDLAGCLLNFYARRLPWPELHDSRLWLIDWVIKNHPDFRLETPYLPQDLTISTTDKEGYEAARELWLAQVNRFPENPDVLMNAAVALKVTDRQMALEWLQHAKLLDPSRFGITDALGNLLAYAILGVAGTDEELRPLTDVNEAKSDFAKNAMDVAMQTADVATKTGIALSALMGDIRYRNLPYAENYDFYAERLLIRAADLEYPNPTQFDALGDFYQMQSFNKRSEGIRSKALVVEKTSDEILESMTPYTRSIVHPNTGIPMQIHVVIGINGHIWSTSPEGQEDKQTQWNADALAKQMTFFPLREKGQSVQVSGSITIYVKPPTPPRSAGKL